MRTTIIKKKTTTPLRWQKYLWALQLNLQKPFWWNLMFLILGDTWGSFLSPWINLLSAFLSKTVSNGLVLTLSASLCKISASDLKKWKQIDRAGHMNS